ncbi:MAG TPA: ATP-binding protein, partial [Actinomycetota bacterium]|nr:ATP-binding protein [Actinomycetota bacterium]
MSPDADPSLGYLRGRLAVVESQVRRVVAHRRERDPDPDDRFRGLYISEGHVDELLAGGARRGGGPGPDPEAAGFLDRLEAEADAAEAGGADLRLRRLARSFGLEGPDLDLLLIALAPDLDPRFERLLAYLQDDVSRRRASTGLALELCCADLGGGLERRRFESSGPLVAGGLLIVEELERPFLTRSLRVPDRVTSFLVGSDSIDALLEPLVVPAVVHGVGEPEPMERTLRSGAQLLYVRESTGAGGCSLGASALRRAGMGALAIDLNRVEGGVDLPEIAAVAAREARLRGAGLVAGPVEALAERGAAAVRAIAESRCQVVVFGSRAWDPTWSRRVPVTFEAPPLAAEERSLVWASALDGGAPPGVDAAAATNQFRLTPEQVFRAAESAMRQAAAEARAVAPVDLQAGARAQNAAGLERLARRVRPQVAWDDLVLPGDVVTQLRELVARARYRERVLDSWGMGRRSSRGRGITALFAGDSGVGKTMSAEVVAADLGLDLYVIDLSTVVDKYVGETEKNLDRIFVEADRVNGVLLFDEADAIFGKRSEVKDAHDRYANVEVAYLLQRMETFDGLAVLTTNLRSNLDEAFTRRLDAIVDFPMPEEEDRERLWRKNLRAELPTSDDVDVRFLAEAFNLSGGNIRNIAVAAAYLAAGEDRPVGMADLVRATEREYRKLGRLCVPAEFGPYYPLIAGKNGPAASPPT